MGWKGRVGGIGGRDGRIGRRTMWGVERVEGVGRRGEGLGGR